MKEFGPGGASLAPPLGSANAYKYQVKNMIKLYPFNRANFNLIL